jgi:PAS domain S-box-containing protein
MSLAGRAAAWQKPSMAIPAKPGRPDTAPALFRLLSESALSRAALSACGVPLALLDANAKGRPFVSVNGAFEAFFGHREGELRGRSLAFLLRGDEALAQRVLGDTQRRWELDASSKDGTLRHIEISLGGLRAADGALTHFVLAFSDRGEVQRLRAEVEQLKSLAASSLGLCLESVAQPAGGAQKPAVEVAPADKLHADRKPGRVLQQR